jgi:ATP-binding cassette subfamily F protein uup
VNHWHAPTYYFAIISKDMPLINLRDICLSWSEMPLFDGVNLAVDKGERLCLMGRNGAGKSTLMKLLEGKVQADSGLVEYQQGVRIARMEQEVPCDSDLGIHAMVGQGLGEIGKVVEHYHQLSHAAQDKTALAELARLQQRLDAENGWQLSQRVDKILSLLDLDGDAPFSGLSGGMKRRVLLARALVQEPDILLLDEPTNHLDMEAIQWLEQFLLGYKTTLLFITHDRAFVRHLATRIIELDRGHLTSWPGNYQSYLDGKATALEVEEKANALFDKRLSQEEKWIRQGIKARRTRNEGRVRALKAMRQEYAERRKHQGTARLTIQQTETSGKMLIEARQLGYSYADKPIVTNFDWQLLRGDRVGILGPNGCGKSTLLKLLLGNLQPQSGSVRHGNQLELAYFDQLRESLDLEASVLDNLAGGSDSVTINGKPKHVMSYLQDFLFSPARARQPVSALSGGERNRLLLAKVFAQSFNLLVLDEPTNDLDVETLELLEEQLQQYEGSLLLVSHDRDFIEATITSTLVCEESGWNTYVGGYEDWLRQKASVALTSGRSAKQAAREPKAGAVNPRKLTYAERLELEKLPAQLEQLENDINTLQQQLNDPTLYQGSHPQIDTLNHQLAEAQERLDNAFLRWSELEDKQG